MTGVCNCGCGTETTNLFAPGHDAKAIHAVLRAKFGTGGRYRAGEFTVAFLTAEGYGLGSGKTTHDLLVAEDGAVTA